MESNDFKTTLEVALQLFPGIKLKRKNRNCGSKACLSNEKTSSAGFCRIGISGWLFHLPAYPGCQRSSRSPAARSFRASSACRLRDSPSPLRRSILSPPTRKKPLAPRVLPALSIGQKTELSLLRVFVELLQLHFHKCCLPLESLQLRDRCSLEQELNY